TNDERKRETETGTVGRVVARSLHPCECGRRRGELGVRGWDERLINDSDSRPALFRVKPIPGGNNKGPRSRKHRTAGLVSGALGRAGGISGDASGAESVGPTAPRRTWKSRQTTLPGAVPRAGGQVYLGGTRRAGERQNGRFTGALRLPRSAGG